MEIFFNIWPRDLKLILVGSKSVWTCAEDGDLDEVIYQIENGFDVNTKKGISIQKTLVQIANENHHLKMLAYLLGKGASIDLEKIFAQNKHFLHFACFIGDIGVVEILLKVNQFKEFLNSEDGCTALHCAAWNGQLKMVERLLQSGVNVHAKTATDLMALHLASFNGQHDVAKYLLEKGAEIEAMALFPILNFDKIETSMANREVDQKDFEKVQNIFNNQSWGFRKSNPLHLASLNGKTEVVKLFLVNDANIEAKDIAGRTPLHWASMYGHLEIVKFLLEKGASIDAKNDYGSTPLHLASMKGHLEIVKLLLGEGANIDAKDENGSTPLHWASRHPEIVELLCEKSTQKHQNTESD